MKKLLLAALLLGFFMCSLYANEPTTVTLDAGLLVTGVWMGDYNDPNGQGCLFVVANNGRYYRFFLGPQWVNYAYQSAITASINAKQIDIMRDNSPYATNEYNAYRLCFHP